MKKQESDILNTLFIEPFINQRILSETSGHSLGVVNKSIKTLIKEGYLDEDEDFSDDESEDIEIRDLDLDDIPSDEESEE